MKNKYDSIMRRHDAYYLTTEVPTTEEVVQQFERAIGHQLPADYRTFLLKYGMSGAGPRVIYSNADDPNGEGGGLGVFYGFAPGDSYDLLRTYRTFAGRLPERLLPIASSPGGQLCLSLTGEDSGRVYWWEQNNLSDDPDDPFILVAYDFDSFMHSLRRISR